MITRFSRFKRAPTLKQRRIQKAGLQFEYEIWFMAFRLLIIAKTIMFYLMVLGICVIFFNTIYFIYNGFLNFDIQVFSTLWGLCFALSGFLGWEKFIEFLGYIYKEINEITHMLDRLS